MNLNEKSPSGWSGTVKAMKKHKEKIDNPYALANFMKKKGNKPHYKPEDGDKESEKKEKYKNEIKSFKDYLKERLNEEMDVMGGFNNGDKVADHMMPRRIGLIINANGDSITVKWQDGKVSTTFSKNLKIVSRGHHFKNGDYVQNQKGNKGVIVNAMPNTNMDIGQSFPVVYVKWEDGKTGFIDANLVQSIAN